MALPFLVVNAPRYFVTVECHTGVAGGVRRLNKVFTTGFRDCRTFRTVVWQLATALQALAQAWNSGHVWCLFLCCQSLLFAGAALIVSQFDQPALEL